MLDTVEKATSTLATYSIKDLEDITGIKAHTLRAWEKRYAIIHPKRTTSNIRYYLEKDLKKLINISLLRKHDFKISKIAEMTEDEIAREVALLTDMELHEQNSADALAIPLIELDVFRFNCIFDRHIHDEGLEATMFNVIYPFFDKLNLLWFSGSISHVHEQFLHTMVKQKILAAIDALPAIKREHAPVILLFLPQFCKYDTTLEFIHYLLLRRNFCTVCLGKTGSVEDILEAIALTSPAKLFTTCMDGDTDQWEAFLEQLHEKTDTPIVLVGQVIQPQNEIHLLQHIANVEGVVDHINTMK